MSAAVETARVCLCGKPLSWTACCDLPVCTDCEPGPWAGASDGSGEFGHGGPCPAVVMCSRVGQGRCTQGALRRGMCHRHYRAAIRSGELARVQSRPEPGLSPVHRAYRRLMLDPSGCLLWTGSRDALGYGLIRREPTKGITRVHRLVYEHCIGPIPEGLQLDHLCRTPSCANPMHLEAVTSRVNNLRGESPAARHAQQTHCVHGHEFTPENIYRPPSSPSRRECKTCRWIRAQARDEARRATEAVQ